MRRVTMLILAAALVGGCAGATKATPLAELELPEPPIEPSAFEEQQVLIRPFDDARPRELGDHHGGAGLVFPSGYSTEYDTPYQRKTEGGGFEAFVGWLPADLPHLLRRALPGDNVRVATAVPAPEEAQQWDYIVEGRLLSTRSYSQGLGLLTAFALVGTPAAIEYHRIEYELSLYHASDPQHPIAKRKYKADERVAVGLYYHHRKRRTMPLRVLENVVADSAKDLVREVANHRARRS